MRIIASDSDLSVVYEAEDSYGSFDVAESGEKTYVTPLAGHKNAHENEGSYLELKVNAPADGLYRLQILQSNNDLCGTHSYNIKIIDRYASFAVNNDFANAKRYFFPNTFSDDTFLEKTIPVELSEGANTIRIYNDNSWNVLWGGSTSTPGTNKLLNFTPNFDKFIITPAIADVPLRETGYRLDISSSDNGYIYADKNTALDGETVTLSLIPEGDITALTLNGIDILPTLRTEDNNLFTAEITVNCDSKVVAAFTPAVEGDWEQEKDEDVIGIDGKHYLISGSNLYKNPSFEDNSGNNMGQWYVGCNTSGHPDSSSYQIPKIKSDGSSENLIPLTDSGYLTTGAFEKDAENTFYYGRDNSSTYLVEHMSNDWRHCAWNGNRSLLSFVPIKENTNYFFSFRAYTLSGKASVRFGAIDMDEGDSFYVPSAYSTAESLNFTSNSFFDCTNGDIQNVGGSWETYSLSFNSGEGADYFLFNAYWLQMCEYLCIGDFRLYELSQAPLTEITSIKAPSALIVQKNAPLCPPTCTEATTEDAEALTLPIEWLNADTVDTTMSGTYIITGRLLLPEGYHSGNSYISMRVIVTENLCEISDWVISGSSAEIKIKCYATENATLFTSTYQNDTLTNVALQPISLVAGKTITATVSVNGNTKLFILDKEHIRPLCGAKALH